jgi:hypothetical protein
MWNVLIIKVWTTSNQNNPFDIPNSTYQYIDMVPCIGYRLSLNIMYVDDKKNILASILCIVDQSMQLNNDTPTNAYAGTDHFLSLCNHKPSASIDVVNIKYSSPIS